MRNAKHEARAALGVASRYGITVKWVDQQGAVPRTLRGPKGHGCSPEKRAVYFVDDKEFPYEHVAEAYLHEVVHVIVQCPWRKNWGIDSVPEDFLLLQFERALARSVCSTREFRRVVEWQKNTCVHMHAGDELWVNHKYRFSPEWKRGFQVARVLGLLDARNRPTFSWPDWKALVPYRRALYGYFQGMESNPYPRLE